MSNRQVVTQRRNTDEAQQAAGGRRHAPRIRYKVDRECGAVSVRMSWVAHRSAQRFTNER